MSKMVCAKLTLGKGSRSSQHHYVRFETDIIPFRSVFYSLMSNCDIYILNTTPPEGKLDMVIVFQILSQEEKRRNQLQSFWR